MKKFFSTPVHPMNEDLVLLLIRVFVGVIFIFAGWGKIQNPMGWMGENPPFPGFMLALAAFAEFAGGLALLLGVVSRLASLGLMCTMIGAIYLHKVVMGDPFANQTGPGSYQPAVLYFILSLVLFVMGPGRLSLDRKIFGAKV